MNPWEGLEDVQRGIFKGESGGDYGALWGHQNRPGGKYENVDITQMTLNELANDFAAVDGDYGQFVKNDLRRIGHNPRVATPMGAYQIVGSTLREAMKNLNLSGEEKFDEAMQDRLGRYIYDRQGTGAWEGYAGPMSQEAFDAATPKLRMPADVPTADTGRLATGDTPLLKFSDEMRQASFDIDAGLKALNEDSHAVTNIMKQQVMQNPTQPLGFGDDVPQMGNPMLPNGQPVTPQAGPPTVSSSNGAVPPPPAAAPEQPGTVDRMLGKLFSNIEDPAARRTKASDLLAGLSQGLGQMSAGAPVDLSQTFQRIQGRQADAAARQQQAQQNQIDNYFKEANLGISQQNAATAAFKAQATAAAAQAEMDGYSFTPEEIAVFASNPAYGDVARDLASPDPAVRKAAYDTINDVRKQEAIASINAGDTDPLARENMANAYTVFTDPEAGPIERANALRKLDNEQIDRLTKFKEVNPTAGIQDAEAYMNGTPEYRAAVDRLKRLQAGTPTDENMDRQFRNTYGQELFKKYAKNVENASEIDAPLQQVLSGQELLLQKGASDDDLTRFFNKTVAAGMRSVAGMLGYAPTADQFLMSQFNLDSEALARIDQGEKALLFTIGQQMLAKQGSVSDSERQMAAQAILSANGAPGAKLRAIAHLQVANSMDRAIYDYYKANSTDAFQNSLELEQEINDKFRALRVPLGNALQQHYMLDNAYALTDGENEDTKLLDNLRAEQEALATNPDMDTPATDEYLIRTSPLMDDQTARELGRFLPLTVQYYRKEDPNTGEIIFVEIPR